MRESKFYTATDVIGAFPMSPEILLAIRFEDKNRLSLTMAFGLTGESQKESGCFLSLIYYLSLYVN